MDIDTLQQSEKGEKVKQVIGTIIGIMLIPVLIGWGMKSQEKKAEQYPWSVTLYYPKDNIYDSKNSEFKTLEECREWALEKADNLNLEEGMWDYECGRGCTYTDESIQGGKEIHTYECVELSR